MENQEFHKQIARYCFNECWNFIDKDARSESEDEEMRRLSEVSLWHWMQVEDRTKENESVGYWQLSRVYALSSKIETALYYADKCIAISEENNLPPFYIGYGYESKARALVLGGRDEEAKQFLQQAYPIAESVSKLDARKLLIEDLDNIREMISNY